jgi:hypothetical protein
MDYETKMQFESLRREIARLKHDLLMFETKAASNKNTKTVYVQMQTPPPETEPET